VQPGMSKLQANFAIGMGVPARFRAAMVGDAALRERGEAVRDHVETIGPREIKADRKAEVTAETPRA